MNAGRDSDASASGLVQRFVRREPEVTQAFRFEGMFHLELLGANQKVRKASGGCEIVWVVKGAFQPAIEKTMKVHVGQWVVRDEKGVHVMDDIDFQAKYRPAGIADCVSIR